MEETLVTPVERAARLVTVAGRVVALTGAGISAESGIPDFRSPGGLWERFDPMEYATLACFLRDPAKAWRLYRALGETLGKARPNAAHAALADLERAGQLAGVVTQNVDGLHQGAGSKRVLEIHGSWRNLECVSCGTLTTPALERPGPERIPRCPACARPLKPGVVLFGESVRHLAESEALLAACEVLLVVGTSAEVAPAAEFPGAVKARGGRVVEFNLEARLPSDVFVPGPVGTTLPALVAALRGSSGACA